MPSETPTPFDARTLPKLTGPSRAPASGGPARQLVVLLHGVGSNGENLIPLADAWRARLPDAAFIAPNGPFPFDIEPMPDAYQWFSISGITRENRPARVVAAAPIIESFLDEMLASHGLANRDLALIGFSQGTIMSFHLALTRTPEIAGIVGYSGRLPDPDGDFSTVAAKPPMLLVHGAADPVIPIAHLDEAAKKLIPAGVAVETVVRPGLPHSIDNEGLERGGDFLARIFGVRP
ncbi:MAG: dienelactone hydrolase family protein [Alphaproteobacteria bacterium]